MPDIAPPRPDSLLGGRYRLVRRCGIGGMGEVWEAEDTVLERRVAVKLVTGDQRHDPAVLARFEREARTGARLVHPNLATVYDYGEADEGAYLVMELLAGETLAERLRRGPLPPTEAAAVVAEAAEALAVAHAAGVTHRDVKPSNLMLTGDGTKVMDFGMLGPVLVLPLARNPRRPVRQGRRDRLESGDPGSRRRRRRRR